MRLRHSPNNVCYSRIVRSASIPNNIHLALVMLAYSFLMLYRLTLPLPPEEAFSPLRHAKLTAFRASADAPLALPGSRPLALPDRSDQDLPSSQKLQKIFSVAAGDHAYRPVCSAESDF